MVIILQAAVTSGNVHASAIHASGYTSHKSNDQNRPRLASTVVKAAANGLHCSGGVKKKKKECIYIP